MAEFDAMVNATGPLGDDGEGGAFGPIDYAVGNADEPVIAFASTPTESNNGFGGTMTPPRLGQASISIDPYFSKPRPLDDPFSNKPNLDF